MKEKDLYEDLVRFYEFQLGKMPERADFKRALETSFTREDLRAFFLLPFLGNIAEGKLENKAVRAGIPIEALHETLGRLVPLGVVDSYVKESVRVYERAMVIGLLECQARVKDDTPLRAVCTRVMNAFIEGRTAAIPTKTPYYRVLPVQATLTGESETAEVAVNTVVPDPREVLPIDVVSEMIKKESLIAVAECYCRATKRIIGEGCEHPLETCFYFNELAQIKLGTGLARRVDYQEAMCILRDCEEDGLVHNVSNCEGQIQTLCNCCTCSCGVMKAVLRGQTNVESPSRYQSALTEEQCTLCGTCLDVCPVGAISMAGDKLTLDHVKCIGCGHCVSSCPEKTLYLTLREKAPKIYVDNAALFRRINMEAMVGLVKRKLAGR